MRRRSRKNATLVGALVLLAFALAWFFAFSREVPFVGHYEVRAEFRDASTLARGSAVRIAGINVGKVTEVRATRPGARTALVTMRLDAGRPIHRDARAVIRQRTSLEGNQFVDLRPGTPSQPEMPDSGTIPASATAAPVQLDQVLGALDAPARRALVRTLDELGRGLNGRPGRAFNRSIRHWRRAYRGTALVGDAMLGERPHDLSEYVGSAGTVAGALDRDPAAVRRLITRFDDTAAAFAAEREALGATISELPATLTVGRRALADVRGALPRVDALARDVRPAVREGVATIEAATPFVAQLRGFLSASEAGGLARDLAPATSALAALTDRLVPLMRETRLGSSCMDRVIIPWGRKKIPDDQFPPTATIFQEAFKGPLPGLSGESRSGDANGQWFAPLVVGGTNVIALGDDNFAATAFPALGVNPQMTDERPPLRPDVPCETQPPTNMRSIPADPPRQFQVSFDTPEAKERLAKARATALDWLRGQLDRQGLGDVLRVSDEDLTPEMLSKLPPTSPDKLDGIIRRRP